MIWLAWLFHLLELKIHGFFWDSVLSGWFFLPSFFSCISLQRSWRFKIGIEPSLLAKGKKLVQWVITVIPADICYLCPMQCICSKGPLFLKPLIIVLLNVFPAMWLLWMRFDISNFAIWMASRRLWKIQMCRIWNA